MELLLLKDVTGIGRKNDLIVVGNGYALNCLLPQRIALVATPAVRKRYADDIKNRAEEREKELVLRTSALAVLKDKKISLSRKVTKTGKLYAAVTEAMVASTLKDQHGIDVRESDVRIDDPIKTTGQHAVSIVVGAQFAPIIVEVKAEK